MAGATPPAEPARGWTGMHLRSNLGKKSVQTFNSWSRCRSAGHNSVISLVKTQRTAEYGGLAVASTMPSVLQSKPAENTIQILREEHGALLTTPSPHPLHVSPVSRAHTCDHPPARESEIAGTVETQ